MKYSVLSATAAAFLVLSMVGCKKQLDTAKAEQVIKDGLKAQAGKAPKTMTCPTDVPLKAGIVFECKGKTDEGQDLVVTVTIKDDAGMVNWKLTSVGGQTAPAGDETKDKAEHKAEPKDEPKAEPKDEGKDKDEPKE